MINTIKREKKRETVIKAFSLSFSFDSFKGFTPYKVPPVLDFLVFLVF
ncbi:hypothetical protein BMS3Abin07_00141 [bacterium BMS3Abin07]|nr:hypothetical protein BMS3Abin07_00141 [bacterium BMS3Abin07]